MEIQGTYKKTINKDLSTNQTLFEMFTIDGFTVHCYGLCPYYPAGIPLIIQGNMNDNNLFLADSIEECGNNVKLTKKYFASQLFGKMSSANAANLAILVGDDLFGFMDKPDAVDHIMLATKKSREWAENIVKIVRETSVQRAILQEMNTVGGTIADMNVIYKRYGDHALSKMQKNPYALMSLKGISFVKCDKLARRYGFAPDCHERLKSLLQYSMQRVYTSGSTRITFRKLWNKIRYQLNNTAYPEYSVSQLEFLEFVMRDNRYLVKDGYIYESWMYKEERAIAYDIARLIRNKISYYITQDDISWIEDSLGVTYDESQKQIFTIGDAGVAVLTGPPGSGKTSTIKGFIRAMQLQKPNIRIMLGATTGCAARHFADSTGLAAETIQRLLKPSPETGRYTYNRYAQLETDIIIVDEFSMADTITTGDLLEAVKNGTLVLFVGDVDQLKSVGAGKVLNDFIQCGKIPVIRLDTIHRQDDGSLIPSNAKKVNNGILPLESDNSTCTFYQAVNDEHAFEIAKWLEETYLKNQSVTTYNFLSVTKKGKIGVENINEYIYQCLFETAPYFRYAGYKFSKNERIMTIENNYSLGYCNGDMGIVLDYDAEGINIRLDHGEEIYLDKDALDDLVPAYAKTVHKAQGSESDNIVFLLSDSIPSMLNREILYTGMTRAKKHLWIIYVGDAIVQCVQNLKATPRNTGLKEMLIELIP